VQAAMLPDVNFIQGKNIEQQQLQTMLRLWDLAQKKPQANIAIVKTAKTWRCK
jgi:hypothetical protein